MLLNGITIQGNYHDKNQDSFICKKINNIYVLVVSDGLGSKKTSELGSKVLCESACDVASENIDHIEIIGAIDFARMVHEKWVNNIGRYRIYDCYATMLLLLVMPKRIVAVRLGDGFISFWTDEQISVLFDQKEDYFANETDCLTEIFDETKIEAMDITYDTFRGGILCSDGVGIGNMTLKEISGFSRDFIEEYCRYQEPKMVQEVEGWLKDWTGADDKTLAFIISEEE